MASNTTARANSKEDFSSCPPPVLPFTLEDIQRIIDNQTAAFDEKFTNIITEISTIKTSIQSLSCDVAELKQRTVAVEASCEKVQEKQDELQEVVEDLEEDIAQMKKEMNDELDKLEAISRRDNLKFFNIPESPDQRYESCADKVVNTLQNTVPDKTWSLDDIVRAHRLGTRTASSVSKPRPMIVKMARWRDKMAIINSGREALKKKGIRVAGDLTTRQRAVLKEHRDRGMHAFYKAGKLIVTGPLRSHENWSGVWHHSDQGGKQNDVSKKKTGQQHGTSRMADNGTTPALLNASEWPALKTPRGAPTTANPSKRPRPPSTPETEPMEPEETAEKWA